jgi:hypothetical protein
MSRNIFKKHIVNLKFTVKLTIHLQINWINDDIVRDLEACFW